MRLKEVLRGKVPPDLVDLVPASFDIVGSRGRAVAILELDDRLVPYGELIAEELMRMHKSVRAVYRKASERKGDYRVRELELLAGEPVTEVLHKEHGYLLKLDISKVYFSPREATERQRVASKVRPGETVMVMFAGVGPYAVAIAKAQPLVAQIIAIEINPEAYRYLVENVHLNKLEGKITPVLGDVREKAPAFRRCCDRVVMPLPKGAYMFLDEAIDCLAGRGVIHFYYWGAEGRAFEEGYELVRRAAEKHGCLSELLETRVVSPYAPRVYKVAIDVLVNCGEAAR
ncbi:MAG: class I SAM-dependent methyltransferase family protein [Thermofilum sp.]